MFSRVKQVDPEVSQRHGYSAVNTRKVNRNVTSQS
jgi:hypothetical protein